MLTLISTLWAVKVAGTKEVKTVSNVEIAESTYIRHDGSVGIVVDTIRNGIVIETQYK